MAPDDLVALARVGRARGLRGDVILRGDPDALALITDGAELTLVRDGERRDVVAQHCRDVKDGVSVRFDGITDRTAAESLRDMRVAVERDRLPEPSVDWFLFELIQDYDVVTTANEPVGRVADRIRTPAQDVLVVRAGDREVLVPAVPAILVSIDADARRLVIEPVPGLLDLNA